MEQKEMDEFNTRFDRVRKAYHILAVALEDVEKMLKFEGFGAKDELIVGTNGGDPVLIWASGDREVGRMEGDCFRYFMFAKGVITPKDFHLEGGK